MVKTELISSMNEIMGDGVDWSKLNEEELSLLVDFFSNTPLVVNSFTERLTPEQKNKIFGKPKEGTIEKEEEDITGIPVVDNVIRKRPLVRAIIGGGIRIK